MMEQECQAIDIQTSVQPDINRSEIFYLCFYLLIFFDLLLLLFFPFYGTVNLVNME